MKINNGKIKKKAKILKSKKYQNPKYLQHKELN